jgi:hypothetical protein
MEDSGGSSEDLNAYRHVDGKECAHEVSDGNKDSVWNWTTGCLCYILTKTLWETEFQDDGLVILAE